MMPPTQHYPPDPHANCSSFDHFLKRLINRALECYYQDRIAPVLADIERHIRAIEQTQTILGERIMATQADIDALTAQLTADVDAINAEIAALQAANPALDLSGLQAAVDAATATANSVPPVGN